MTAEEKGLPWKASSSESFNFSRSHPRTPVGRQLRGRLEGLFWGLFFHGNKVSGSLQNRALPGRQAAFPWVIKSLLWAPRGTNFTVCGPKGPSNYGWKPSLLAQSYCLAPCSRTAGCKTWALRVTTLVHRGLWALAQTGPGVSRALWGKISTHISKTSKES